MHVLPVAFEFLKAYPEIDLRMVLTDRIINLFEEPADLAVRIGELADSSLIASKLGSIRRVICASPAYFAVRGTPQSPRELGAHDCITFEGLMSPKFWAFRAGKSDIAVPIRSRLTVNTAEAAIDAAIAGVGITRVLAYQMAKAIEDGTLVTALEAFEPMPVPVSLVYQGQGQLPLKLRAFLDFAAPRLRARLCGLGRLSWEC